MLLNFTSHDVASKLPINVAVERVYNYKYLGTVLPYKLAFNDNTDVMFFKI